MLLAKSMLLFIAAGLCEIGGGYLIRICRFQLPATADLISASNFSALPMWPD